MRPKGLNFGTPAAWIAFGPVRATALGPLGSVGALGGVTVGNGLSPKGFNFLTPAARIAVPVIAPALGPFLVTTYFTPFIR